MGGSHKRWLEEEWREDIHGGALSKEDIYKRWFGETALDWLKAIFTGVTNEIELKHTYIKDFILNAKLEVYAEISVEADVNYGFTLIGKLGGKYGIDISDSYLYYRTASEVDAKFVVDAAVTAFFNTGDVIIFNPDTFSAAFIVPGIVTIGPNFKLFGQLEGKATLSINFKTRNKKFTSLDSCAVNLVADGHVAFHAEAEASSSGNRFCYGVDVSADLYATLEAPEIFSWALPDSPFMIMPANDVTIFLSASDGKACTAPGSRKLRRRDADFLGSRVNTTSSSSAAFSHSKLSKRATRYGSLVPQIEGLMCPGEVDLHAIPSCPACEGGDDDTLRKRDDGVCWLDPYGSGEERCPGESNARRAFTERSTLERRGTKAFATWVDEYGDKWPLPFPDYPSCGEAGGSVLRWYGYPPEGPRDCHVVLEKYPKNEIDPSEFVTEHVYEAQFLAHFFAWLREGDLPGEYKNPKPAWIMDVLLGIGASTRVYKYSGWSRSDLWNELAIGIGGNHQPGRLALAHEGVNGRKGVLFRGNEPSALNEDKNTKTLRAHRNFAGVFYYMRRSDIWSKFVETSKYMENVLDDFDLIYPWTEKKAMNDGQLGRRDRDTSKDQPMAGLRDLYCFWLDFALADIESKAANWLTAATANYRAEFGSSSDGKNWLDNVLTTGGYISASNLKFSQASVKHNAANPSNPDIWTRSNYQGLWDAALGPAGPF